ncbi:uncharacterized protein SPAPADRAFT_150258 [Spathaspora passalidarum NRRL Y-27907]|uniref:Repressor of RNA polymerase III transcription MAF1 n=1 Tax=Spathaspora passalidarum (strain NRRL Y-27907 / 11-Y1) TaxID=619300 RepID=G3AKE2_SPAPN|nr:uncharacterized protein SPAPADRAFT_150258 [Spathaspora passalidarum NRRL Y-27907]EGW32899.1 hypothetical protein SPAPADRAFT_150258 [Spathaspora passalidarum NRRL Y-27907]
MKFIDEVDLELVNQELNFHSPDNNLVIQGGCDLFTTKPIGYDRKLFKTIDKHLDQIIEDNQLSRSLERERKNSIISIFGNSSSPPLHGEPRRGSMTERDRRASHNSANINFARSSSPVDHNDGKSLLSRSLIEDSTCEYEAVDESPFGPLKNVTTRKTFAYLIAILNISFPDQDFTNLQPTTENFYRIESPEDLIHRFNNILLSLGKKEDILNWIWDIINSYMDVIPSKSSSPYLSAQNVNHAGGHGSRKNSFNARRNSNGGSTSPSQQYLQDGCQIYQFQPSDESIFEDLTYPYQPMWSYYWFIYNKKKKRVTFLHLTAINKAHYSNVNANKEFEQKKKSQNDKIITGDDEEEYDENDEYMDSSEVAIIDEEDDNTDVVGDLEI